MGRRKKVSLSFHALPSTPPIYETFFQSNAMSTKQTIRMNMVGMVY